MKRGQWYGALIVACVGMLAAVVCVGDVPTSPPQRPKAEVFSGTIRNVDPAKRLITVVATPITKTFGVPPDCEVMTQNKPKASLTDLMIGSVAVVTYEDASGALIADRIQQEGPPAETSHLLDNSGREVLGDLSR